jgi:hypothetical protein
MTPAQKRLMTWMACMVIGGLTLVMAVAFGLALAFGADDSGGTSPMAPIYARCVP